MSTAAMQAVHRPGAGLGPVLLDALQRHPGRVAMVDETRAVTYAQLLDLVAQAAQRLEALGLREGDVVAQLSGNRIEMFAVMAAAYIRGFCSVTLHPMASAGDHRRTLQDCQARVLISEPAYAEKLFQEGGELRLHHLSHEAGAQGFWPAAQDAAAAALAARGTAESIIRLAYTGGTTGRAKGVMLSSRAMLSNAQLWLAGLAWPDGVMTLCSAPISHGAGSLIYPTLLRGGTVVLERGFEVGRWLDNVQRHRIAFTFIVPTMLYALLDDARTSQADLRSLQALIYGASPAAPARIAQALEHFGPVLVQTYGQSEAPNTLLLLDQHAHAGADARRLAAAGKPFPGVELALLGEDGLPVAAGQVGEICVRGPLVMSGYLGLPEQTAQALAGDYLHTGDLALQDDQGYFYLVDRKKDMVISGGFNVYAREVEDVLCAHPAVSQVAVIGVPDARWGEAVLAVVVCRDGHSVAAHTLQALVRAAKGPISTPKHVVFEARLPLTGLGKPDKKALRARFSQGLGESLPADGDTESLPGVLAR